MRIGWRTALRLIGTTVVEREPTLESPLETAFWSAYLDALPRPLDGLKTQHLVRVANGQTFRLDLALVRSRIAIELDGYQWHGDRRGFERDRQRDRLLMNEGWIVIRFSGSEVLRDPALCVKQAAQLARRWS
jgi:very-short-patch-repair endonuclease